MDDRRLQQIVDALPAPPPTEPDGLPFGNRRDPLEELVYILLTLMTRSQASIERTFARLLELSGGDLASLDVLPHDSLVEALRPVGFANRRAAQLQKIARSIPSADQWSQDLRAARTEEVLAELCRLPGVGAKTAKCVAMYSLGRAVLPVDVHVLRVAKRLELVDASVSWARSDPLLEALVPDDLKFDVHVRFVAHGRDTCFSTRPACERCPVADVCPSAGTPGAPRRTYTG